MGIYNSTFYPDANPESTSFDGGASNAPGGSNWATTRSATSSTSADDSSSTIYTETYTGYVITRSFLLFDISSIPSTATINSATIGLYKNATAVSNANTSACCLVSSTPASNTSLSTADFDQVGTTRLATDVNYSGISTSAYFTFSLNASGLSHITSAIGGVVKFGLRDKRDLDDSAPTGVNSIAMNSADAGSNKPYLEINYTGPDVGGTAIFFAGGVTIG